MRHRSAAPKCLSRGTWAEPPAGTLEGEEAIDRWAVTWDEGLATAREGRIRDAKTLIGLLYDEVFFRPGFTARTRRP